MRRPSLALSKGQDEQERSDLSNDITIRARVLPRAKERKPFLIQRRFDLGELRNSLPTIQKTSTKSVTTKTTYLRRSSRSRQSIGASVKQSPNLSRRMASLGSSQGGLAGPGAVPIREHL
jgi:hypothetical protein